jgi:chromate transporter
MKILLQLFWSFLQIGLFSFGGGYAALPLIQEQVVTLHQWMAVDEFADLVTISQMTPGPIALNAASFVGARMAGIPGSLSATFGCIAPACLIVLALAWIYKKYRKLRVIEGALRGLRPAVVGLIATAAITMFSSSFFSGSGASVLIPGLASIGLPGDAVDLCAAGSFAVCLFILRKYKISPILVMLGSGIVGLIVYSIVGL